MEWVMCDVCKRKEPAQEWVMRDVCWRKEPARNKIEVVRISASELARGLSRSRIAPFVSYRFITAGETGVARRVRKRWRVVGGGCGWWEN